MDGDSAGFNTRLGLSRSDVFTAADPGDLQIALVVGVCDAKVVKRKSQRSTFRDCVGIPCDRSELPVGHSVVAAIRNSMNAKAVADRGGPRKLDRCLSLRISLVGRNSASVAKLATGVTAKI